ncbi:MAG: hypothetical protein EPO24_03770 [Bacteroidetes bacterium]|nr:MAG: hypothetical protein EPO24_03770 [Bacteroidota bacterium]
MSGGLVSYYIHAPDWIGTSLIIFSLISALFYLYSYFYFMSRDKDSLRSEKYSIQKLAIEKGLVGDNIQGLFDLNPQINLRVLSSSTTDEKENR